MGKSSIQTNITVQPLVGVLPASILKDELVGMMPLEVAPHLFVGMREIKDPNLPTPAGKRHFGGSGSGI